MARTGAIEQARLDGSHVHIRTTPCVVCGAQYYFTLNNEGYVEWQYGQKIQDAFPELSDADREILISGTCDECFNQLFPPEEE